MSHRCSRARWALAGARCQFLGRQPGRKGWGDFRRTCTSVLPLPRGFHRHDPASYRLYLVTDDRYADDNLEQQILDACAGGVSIVQLRLKHAATADYVRTAQSILCKLRISHPSVPLVVDDRADVCLASGAHGLHVGNGDLDPAMGRRLIGAERLLGVSTYGQADLMREVVLGPAQADYVAGGGVYASSTKAYPTKGPSHLHTFKLATMAAEAQAGRRIPVVAIGGIDADNVWPVCYAGADSAACVAGLLAPSGASTSRERARAILERLEDATSAKTRARKFSPGDAAGHVLSGETLVVAVRGVRSAAPLVHCITNYVSMDVMANVLLSAGASPAMVHDADEVAELASVCGALSLNVGTVSSSWALCMRAAAEAASKAGKPIVLDPVAAGVLTFRTNLCRELLTDVAKMPAILRGNPSEILACCRAVGIHVGEVSTAHQSGVDSSLDSLAVDRSAVDALARHLGGGGARSSAVAVTGRTDYITDGHSQRYLVCHDVPSLQQITAAGCSLSSLIGAFAATDPNYARAAAHACCFYTLAAQMAQANSSGPGSLRTALMDQLATIDDEILAAFARIETL